MKCPHCNSESIEVGLRMFESLNGSPVGFRFSKGIMSVVAQIHCDICKDCKTIVSSQVKCTDFRHKVHSDHVIDLRCSRR
jgi:hypothetical protein